MGGFDRDNWRKMCHFIAQFYQIWHSPPLLHLFCVTFYDDISLHLYVGIKLPASPLFQPKHDDKISLILPGEKNSPILPGQGPHKC